MARKSRFPDALDVRQIVTPGQVAEIAGVEVEAAGVVIDADLFGSEAVAASGATVVRSTGLVIGPADSAVRRFVDTNLETLCQALGDDELLADRVAASMPSESPTPRYHPVFDWELVDLTKGLARCHYPDVTGEAVDRILDVWTELCSGLADRADGNDVVVRRSWDVLERDFEDWLELHLDTLFGEALDLVKRQWRTPSGKVADLVARVVNPSADSPFEHGTPVVIENKAGEATRDAVHQVYGYAVEADAVFDGGVLPVLAATGIGDRAEVDAGELGVVTRTWGEVGYLDHLWCPEGSDTPVADFLHRIRTDSSD